MVNPSHNKGGGNEENNTSQNNNHNNNDRYSGSPRDSTWHRDNQRKLWYAWSRKYHGWSLLHDNKVEGFLHVQDPVALAKSNTPQNNNNNNNNNINYPDSHRIGEAWHYDEQRLAWYGWDPDRYGWVLKYDDKTERFFPVPNPAVLLAQQAAEIARLEEELARVTQDLGRFKRAASSSLQNPVASRRRTADRPAPQRQPQPTQERAIARGPAQRRAPSAIPQTSSLQLEIPPQAAPQQQQHVPLSNSRITAPDDGTNPLLAASTRAASSGTSIGPQVAGLQRPQAPDLQTSGAPLQQQQEQWRQQAASPQQVQQEQRQGPAHALRQPPTFPGGFGNRTVPLLQQLRVGQFGNDAAVVENHRAADAGKPPHTPDAKIKSHEGVWRRVAAPSQSAGYKVKETTAAHISKNNVAAFSDQSTVATCNERKDKGEDERVEGRDEGDDGEDEGEEGRDWGEEGEDERVEGRDEWDGDGEEPAVGRSVN